MSTQLEQAQQRLQQYLDAEARILQSQEYVVGQGGTARRNRRADLEQVRAGIKECRDEITRLQPAPRRVSYLRPY